MKMKNRVKIFLATVITCGSLALIKTVDAQSIKIVNPPTINYEDFDIEENPVFATYDTGKIYFTKDETNIDEEPADIIIVDMRDEKENMQIVSSYRITNRETQLEVIDIMLEYNDLYPSETPWIRTKDSIANEWLIHNIAYFLHYKRDHSASADFENKEEDTYTFRLIK